MFGVVAPTRLGRYRLVCKAGEGGMGVVYEALDEVLERRIALKVIRPDRAGPQTARRFAREANAMARVTHANVVTVFDVGQSDGQLFIAMEFVDGPTLTDWLGVHARPTSRVVAMFQSIAIGMDAAHKVGVVHRDFKPDNVMIASGGVPKVADFGLASLFEDGLLVVPTPPSRPVGQRITETAAIVGTPRYAAPEVLVGGAADARSDQFSFCAALFEALYGVSPIRGETLAELRESARLGSLAWPRRDSHPRHLRDALARGLERVPSRRWPSMAALGVALGADKRFPWRGLGVTLGGAAVVAGASFGGGGDAGRCTADAELAMEWGDRQDAVRHALERAPDTSAAVVREVDDFVARWGSAYRVECAAVGAPKRRDTTLACLAEERAHLRHTLALLTAGQDRVVARALGIVRALPEPNRCRDVAPTTPGADPGDANSGAHGRDEIARAAVLERGGKLDEAHEVAQSVLKHARDEQLESLVLEAEARLGSILLAKVALTEAESHLRRAYEMAVSADRTRLAGKIAADLSGVYAGAEQADASIRWAKSSAALARREGDDLGLVTALNALQAAYRRADQPEAARTAIEDALELAERVYPPGDGTLGILRWNRALVDWRLGDLDAAEEGSDVALGMLRSAFGPSHPLVGRVLMTIASLHNVQQRHAQALEASTQALAVLEGAMGTQSPRLFNALAAQAQASCALGQTERAVQIYQRARELATAAYGADSAKVVHALNMTGACYTRVGDHDKALAFERLAVTLVEQASEPRRKELCNLKTNLAQNLMRLGQLDEALRLSKDGAALAEEIWGSDNPELVYSHQTITVVLNELGRFGEAAGHANKVVELTARHFDPDGAMMRVAKVNAGLTELGRGDPEAAAAHLIDGLTISEALFGAGSAETVPALVALGRARLLQRRADDAAALAELAMETVEPSDYNLGKALFLRARATSSRADARQAIAAFERSDSWPGDVKIERVRAWLEQHRQRRR